MFLISVKCNLHREVSVGTGKCFVFISKKPFVIPRGHSWEEYGIGVTRGRGKLVEEQVRR